jgi:hypothetical protein
MALEKDPGRRIQRAGMFAEMLREAANGRGAQSAQAASPSTSPSAKTVLIQPLTRSPRPGIPSFVTRDQSSEGAEVSNGKGRVGGRQWLVIIGVVFAAAALLVVFQLSRKKGDSTARDGAASSPDRTTDERPAPLRIRALPSGANAKITIVGIGPYYDGILVPLGKYDVTVEAVGFKPFRGKFSSGSGEFNEIKLEPAAPARFSVQVSVEPSEAQVRIMNIRERYYPDIELPVGKYNFEAASKGYVTKEPLNKSLC